MWFQTKIITAGFWVELVEEQTQINLGDLL